MSGGGLLSPTFATTTTTTAASAATATGCLVAVVGIVTMYHGPAACGRLIPGVTVRRRDGGGGGDVCGGSNIGGRRCCRPVGGSKIHVGPLVIVQS